MKATILWLALTMAATQFAYSAETTFVGKAIKQEIVKGVTPDCPEGQLCFGIWSRWTIQVDKILSGPTLPKVIVAAAVQSSLYNEKALGCFNNFVAQPVSNEDRRSLLGADFILVNHAKETSILRQECK